MKKVNITSVCDINVGKTPSRANPSYWGEGFKWLSIADMNQGSVLSDTKETITEKAIKECNCKIVPQNTVLFSFKLSIGKVGITKIPMYTNEAIAAFVINDSSKLDNKYLYYVLKSVDHSIGSNKAVMGKTLNKEQLKKIHIPLPSLPDQKRIVHLLDQADALRQKRKQAIALLDDYLKAVFLDMFGDPVKNPKGWEVEDLGKIINGKGDIVDGPFGSSIDTSVDYISNGEIPVIRTKNVGIFEFIDEDLKFITRKKYETVIRSQVLPGDIILTKVGTIGNLCIFPGKYKEAVLSTTGSCRIRVLDEIVNRTFLINFLNLYKPQMKKIASAAVQSFLNMKHIKSFKIFLVPNAMQNEFANIVQNIESLKQSMLTQSTELETQFQALMQKAFRGEY